MKIFISAIAILLSLTFFGCSLIESEESTPDVAITAEYMANNAPGADGITIRVRSSEDNSVVYEISYLVPSGSGLDIYNENLRGVPLNLMDFSPYYQQGTQSSSSAATPGSSTTTTGSSATVVDPGTPMPYTVLEVTPYFYPSGVMECGGCTVGDANGEYTFTYTGLGAKGWAGVQFLHNENWGHKYTHTTNYSVAGAKQLEFDAKGTGGVEFIIKALGSSTTQLKFVPGSEFSHYTVTMPANYTSITDGPLNITTTDAVNTGTITLKNIKLTTDEPAYAYRYKDTYKEPASNNVTPLVETSHTGTWRTVWEDTFTGDTINSHNWNIEVGNGPNNDGWGNQHADYSTDDPEAIYIESGILKIKATNVTPDGATNPMIQSAHINTLNKKHFKYGRVSARIRMPYNNTGTTPASTWSAFWMLGASCGQGGTWPSCGEIDIVEAGGKIPTQAVATIIEASTHPDSRFYELNADIGSRFYEYAIEWDYNNIKFFVDNTLIHTVNISGQSQFKKEFYIIINASFGGAADKFTNLKRDVPILSNFPATMEIDWVRYETRD